MMKVEEEESLWQAWRSNRDPHAGDRLVQKYSPLVTFHVQRIGSGLPRTVSRDDLMSLAYQGLFDALTKFDPGRDLKFDTYASFRIRGAILDGLRKEDRLSRTAREKTKKMEQAIAELEQQIQRHATPEEVANHLSISVEEVYQTMHEHYFSAVLSMDEKMSDEDDDGNQSFLLKDEQSPTPEENIVKTELLQDLAEKIKELNANEQLVLSLFYSEEMTLTEIGEIMELSTSRISQIHSKALFKLRQLLTDEIMDGGIL